jgi:hypothetical protein
LSSNDEMNEAPPSISNNNTTTHNSNINNQNNLAAPTPHFIDPMLIPPLVRRTLLEIHEQAVMSKSDSNIKAKYRSSNHLLHSPHHSVKPAVAQATSGAGGRFKKNSGKNRKKKPLSLQNSQDKSVYHAVTPVKNAASTQHSGNILNMVYDELKSKFFRNNSVETNKSTGSSSNDRTQIPTPSFQQQTSQQSHQQQKPQQLIPMSQLSPSGSVVTQPISKSPDNMDVGTVPAKQETPEVAQTNQLSSNYSTINSLTMMTMVKHMSSSTNVSSFRKPLLVSTGCGLNQVGASMSSESDCTVILNAKYTDRHTTIQDSAAEMDDEKLYDETKIEENKCCDENNNNDDEAVGLLVLAPNVKIIKLGKPV